MARHLEFVFGPLGEETRLPCACPRAENHLRPSSTNRRAEDDPAELARPVQLRPRRRRGHRSQFRFISTAHPRHAA